jgi:RNA recognition motif-containing protein
MANKLYVGNLSSNITTAQVRSLFAEFGEVTEIHLVTDRYTNTPKGFGFVDMATEEGARNAVKKLDGYMLDNRSLKVNEARTTDRLKSGPSNSNGNRRS